MEKIELFIDHLSQYQSPLVFNPWKDCDTVLERPDGPSIRKKQLSQYLQKRIKKAKFLLIAEACGYQGGHFTGIAMTSERMILNAHPTVDSKMVLGTQGQRTSRPDSPLLKRTQQEKGFNEPTDSIVWSACLTSGLSPDDFLLWNIFPFHPYKKGNQLSNRTPLPKELEIGLGYARELLSLCPPLPLLTIGKKSEATLSEAGFSVVPLRHPANGGARQFTQGLQQFLKTKQHR